MFPRNDSTPARWGITGGIGSGKSYVCRRLAERGFPVFYCDDEAKRLIRTDPELRLRLTEIVGAALYDDAGRLNKAVMAAYLCGGAEQAARVDAEVHPRVAREFLRWAGEQRAPVVVMECALLFEARFDRLVDRRILVAAPRDVRLRRVMARDSVTAAVPVILRKTLNLRTLFIINSHVWKRPFWPSPGNPDCIPSSSKDAACLS